MSGGMKVLSLRCPTENNGCGGYHWVVGKIDNANRYLKVLALVCPDCGYRMTFRLSNEDWYTGPIDKTGPEIMI